MLHTFTDDELLQFCKLASQQTLEAAGLAGRMISYSEGCRIYGAWFRESVRSRRLTPSRVGQGGRNRTQSFRISDIEAAILADKQAARLEISKIN